MRSYLIDTDVLIDHLRGEETAKEFLRRVKKEGSDLLYSVITKAELYSGVRKEEEESVASLLGSMGEIAVNGKIAEAAGRYRKKFYSSHSLLLPDALVAASAREAGAVLVTLNRRHYPMNDIEVEVPYRRKSNN